jgi:hypothetical protein
MNKVSILVAPRELKDQVERANRVLGCEASVADRLAEDVTFCEINYGQGISSWLEIATLDSMALDEVLKSSLLLRLPTNTKSVDVHFNSPVLFVLLALTLHNQENCGIAWSCDSEVTSGSSPVFSVYLRSDTSLPPPLNHKTVAALSTGLKVSLHEWDQLNKIASKFLMSEEILDGS